MENKIEDLVKKVNKLEEILNKGENLAVKEKTKIKCSVCDFQAISEQGLKVHTKRKHTLTGNETYPRKCDLCEITLEKRKEMKAHMKFHSYKKASFKCEECEFIGENHDTMVVHIGKHHSDNFECGLC